MEIEDTSLEFEIRFRIPRLRLGCSLRLSREASVALPFFCSLHYCSLCRIILNENKADFPYSG